MAPISDDSAAGADDRLTMESIPVIDLRRFTQSELTALSRCSAHAVDLSRCDDVVIPKIDRAVFNESAGSRKQTYSRFRLARAKPALSAKPLPLAPGPILDDPERAENVKIISLFKQLFNGESQCAEMVPVNVEYNEALPARSNFAVMGDGGETRRKRGRKPKSEKLDMESESRALVAYDNREEKEKVIVNKNGVVVDLVELAKLEDPFAAEIRRRTEGMEKDAQLLVFLNGLDGQWGSRRKRRKIVDANEFGDALPNGWKVLVGMKKKEGQCWLFCRGYISPNGRYFMSCKEVSSYLMSLCGFPDAKPLPLDHCSEASQMENKLLSRNAQTTHTKDRKAISLSSVAFEPDDHGKQSSLVKDDHVGVLQGAGLYMCHKCSTRFHEKNHLLQHLLSCHKRKRRKAGMPMEDDELIKEGHYGCQFCDKKFTERVCFFGHVGIHVKNYVKSIEGSPALTLMQNHGLSISASEIPHPDMLEKPGSTEACGDSVAWTPEIAATNECNIDTSCGKLQGESDLKNHAQSGDHKAILSSVDGDQVNMACGIDRDALEESADKGSAVPGVMDEDVVEAEKSTDIAGVKIVSCSGDENVRSSSSKNDTCWTSIQENVMEAIGNISESKVQSTDGLISEVEKSAGLVNNGNGFFIDRKDGKDEQMISQCEPLDNDKNKLVNEDTKASLTSDNVAKSRYNEKLKDSTIDKEVTYSSGKSVLDRKVNVLNDAQQEKGPASNAVVSQGKEETVLTEFFYEMNSERSQSTQDNLQRCATDGDAKGVSMRASSRVNLGASDFKNVMPFDADSFNSNGRDAGSVFILPGQGSANVAPDDAHTFSAFGKLEPRKESKDEMNSERSLSAQDNLQRCATEEDAKGVSMRSTSGVNLGASDSKNVMPFDADSLNSSGRDTRTVFVLPGQGIANVAPDDAHTFSAFRKLEPRKESKDDGFVNISCPSPIVAPREEQCYATESIGPCKTSSTKELKCDEVVNSKNSFNPRSGLDADLVNHEDVVKITSSYLYSSLGSREAPNGSNLYGTRNSVTKEAELGRDSFSSLPVGGHADCITGQIHHNRDIMNDFFSTPCATHLPDLGKAERSGVVNKVILDFGNSMSDINTGVLPSFPHETIPASPSPFSLWNDQPFGVEQNQSGDCDSSREEALQDQGSECSSLSLASFQQTCNVGYNLNETYISTVENFPRLNALETHRDTDLMIGFRNMNARPNQDIVTEALWRSNEGHALATGIGDTSSLRGQLGDSSSSQGQPTGAFQSFDFLSDKGDNDIFSVNEKFYSIANFGGLRSAPVEPMEFSFLPPQDSNRQLGDPKVFSYGNSGMEQGFESSVWLGKDASLPNMNHRNAFSMACVLCGSQFQQESIESVTRGSSIGYLCPTCKRISGQLL